jgi:hypothetical protein
VAENKQESGHGGLAFIQRYTVPEYFSDMGVWGASLGTSLCMEAEELELDPQSCIAFRGSIKAHPAPNQGFFCYQKSLS